MPKRDKKYSSEWRGEKLPPPKWPPKRNNFEQLPTDNVFPYDVEDTNCTDKTRDLLLP